MKRALGCCAAGLLLVAVPLSRANGVSELEPAPIAWVELQRRFDLRWCLPDVRRSAGRDLLQEMETLVALRFEIGPPSEPSRCFGDLVDAAGRLGGNERRTWLEELAQRNPELFAVWGWPLRELLLDDQLFARGWDPGRDLPRDGFFFIDAWDLSRAGAAPWSDLKVRPLAEQGATLMRADVATIKDVEYDYGGYGDDAGDAYELLRPVPGSFVYGTDDDGQPFSSLIVRMRRDLALPYGDYDLQLRALNRIDTKGRFVTHVYTTSRDFHWLAGRDTFLPVTQSDGTWVAQLVVRASGFDLDGVPDGARHRRESIREGLGNVRRKSERLFRERGRVETQDNPLPAFRVMASR